MLLAFIILALWVAILAPGVVRWVREHQPTTSIASFHRQLRLLEGSGPKLVEPAYRLGGMGSARSEREAPSPEHQAPRLMLVPEGATDKESTTMRYDDRYETEDFDGQWEEAPPSRMVHARRTVRVPADYDEVDDYARRTHDVTLSPDGARARRMRIIVGMGATIAATFMLGLLPGMTFLWAVTLIAVVALAAYLGLMYYAAHIGLYGNESSSQPTRIARVVVPAYDAYDDEYVNDDDGWDVGRVAAAR